MSVQITPRTRVIVGSEFQYVPLDTLRGHIAISHVWGSPVASRPLNINGMMVSVPLSSEAKAQALSRVFAHYSDSQVWLDIVAINQTSVADHNSQVKYMGQVYRNAERVVVILDREDTSKMIAYKRLTNVFFWSFIAVSRALLCSAYDPIFRDGNYALTSSKREAWPVFVQEAIEEYDKYLIRTEEEAEVMWGILIGNEHEDVEMNEPDTLAYVMLHWQHAAIVLLNSGEPSIDDIREWVSIFDDSDSDMSLPLAILNYNTRVWTNQERVNAAAIDYYGYDGQIIYSFEELVDLRDALVEVESDLELRIEQAPESIRNYYREWDSTFQRNCFQKVINGLCPRLSTLAEVKIYNVNFSYRQCQRRHDIVYGTAGLLGLSVDVNYEDEFIDVYRNFVVQLIAEGYAVPFKCISNRHTTSVANLPSWFDCEDTHAYCCLQACLITPVDEDWTKGQFQVDVQRSIADCCLKMRTVVAKLQIIDLVYMETSDLDSRPTGTYMIMISDISDLLLRNAALFADSEPLCFSFHQLERAMNMFCYMGTHKCAVCLTRVNGMAAVLFVYSPMRRADPIYIEISAGDFGVVTIGNHHYHILTNVTLSEMVDQKILLPYNWKPLDTEEPDVSRLSVSGLKRLAQGLKDMQAVDIEGAMCLPGKGFANEYGHNFIMTEAEVTLQ